MLLRQAISGDMSDTNIKKTVSARKVHNVYIGALNRSSAIRKGKRLRFIWQNALSDLRVNELLNLRVDSVEPNRSGQGSD
eukprot:5052199-Amphidinium_carterae.2